MPCHLLPQLLHAPNEYMRNLTFDSVKDEIVENDGLLRYGLQDFVSDFKARELMYNLNQGLALIPK